MAHHQDDATGRTSLLVAMLLEDVLAHHYECSYNRTLSIIRNATLGRTAIQSEHQPLELFWS